MSKNKAEVVVIPNEVEQLIKNRSLLAAGMGIVPIPLFNFVSATAVQISLVQAISKQYGNEAKKSWIKNILSSVLGGALSTGGSAFLAGGLLHIPLVGFSLSVLSAPALNGLTTYAIGYMFVRYYESEKGFVKANAEAFGNWFKDGFKQGREKLGSSISGKTETVSASMSTVV
jgi:uncharacterized protein (DUF697 family)